jgi:hypothetical protein
MKNFVDYTSRKCFASARVAVPRLKRLGYAIHSHSFSGLVIQIAIDRFSLGARHLFQKLVFFLCEVTLVIHCCFQNKILSLSEFPKKRYVFPFDSLTLKPLRLYVNLVSHFVAYSQPFNLVH